MKRFLEQDDLHTPPTSKKTKLNIPETFVEFQKLLSEKRFPEAEALLPELSLDEILTINNFLPKMMDLQQWNLLYRCFQKPLLNKDLVNTPSLSALRLTAFIISEARTYIKHSVLKFLLEQNMINREVISKKVSTSCHPYANSIELILLKKQWDLMKLLIEKKHLTTEDLRPHAHQVLKHIIKVQEWSLMELCVGQGLIVQDLFTDTDLIRLFFNMMAYNQWHLVRTFIDNHFIQRLHFITSIQIKGLQKDLHATLLIAFKGQWELFTLCLEKKLIDSKHQLTGCPSEWGKKNALYYIQRSNQEEKLMELINGYLTSPSRPIGDNKKIAITGVIQCTLLKNIQYLTTEDRIEALEAVIATEVSETNRQKFIKNGVWPSIEAIRKMRMKPETMGFNSIPEKTNPPFAHPETIRAYVQDVIQKKIAEIQNGPTDQIETISLPFMRFN